MANCMRYGRKKQSAMQPPQRQADTIKYAVNSSEANNCTGG
jgi:hypothetical protein